MEAKKNLFVGYSPKSSFDEALQDAAEQARGVMPDAMVEFTVTSIRGRIGGIGALRDLWVEIRVPLPHGQKEEDEGTYTTMAIGEEGGDELDDGTPLSVSPLTMDLGEDGGDERTSPGGEREPLD